MPWTSSSRGATARRGSVEDDSAASRPRVARGAALSGTASSQDSPSSLLSSSARARGPTRQRPGRRAAPARSGSYPLERPLGATWSRAVADLDRLAPRRSRLPGRRSRLSLSWSGARDIGRDIGADRPRMKIASGTEVRSPWGLREDRVQEGESHLLAPAPHLPRRARRTRDSRRDSAQSAIRARLSESSRSCRP